MASKQIIIDIAEIKTARLTCPKENCMGVLEFAIPPINTPTVCHDCGHRFIGNSLKTIMDFLEYMRLAQSNEPKLSFVIPDIPPKD